MGIYRRTAALAAGVIIGTTIGMAPAGATLHSYGGCTWSGVATPSAGKEVASDGIDDCALVQARILVYVGPGTIYSYGPEDPSTSVITVGAGFLTGSSRGKCASCIPLWSSYLVD